MGVSWESLGLLEALLGSFKSEKMLTVPRENHLFVNADFWLFAAPNGSLGLILVRLGRIWFQNGFPKSFPKCYQTFFKKLSKKGPILGSKMGAKKYENRDRRLKAFSTGDSVLSFIDF